MGEECLFFSILPRLQCHFSHAKSVGSMPTQHNNSLVVEKSEFFSSSFILQQQHCHSTNSVAGTTQQMWNGFFPSDNSQFLVTSTKEKCAFAKRRTSCLSLHPKLSLLFLQITKNAPPKNTNHFWKKNWKKFS